MRANEANVAGLLNVELDFMFEDVEKFLACMIQQGVTTSIVRHSGKADVKDGKAMATLLSLQDQP